jgi:hypothetical protein
MFSRLAFMAILFVSMIAFQRCLQSAFIRSRKNVFARNNLYRISLLTCVFCFLPMKIEGLWKSPDGTRWLSHDDCYQYDRTLYGYVPTYRWVFSLGEEKLPNMEVLLTLKQGSTALLVYSRWTIEWSVVCLEVFLLATLCANSDHRFLAAGIRNTSANSDVSRQLQGKCV